MGQIFRMDSNLFKGMNKAGNVMLVSLMWLIGCIPIVTIGASTTAMYYTMVKAVRRENGYITQEFCRSYRQNLKKSIPMTIFFLVTAVVLYVDRAYMQQMKGQIAATAGLFYALLTLVVIALFHYIFPVMSRFTFGKTECMKMAGIMVFRHLPHTILMLGITILAVCVIWLIPIPMIFVMPGGCCYLNSFIMEKLLLQYMAEPETEEERQMWYYQQ